VTGCRAPAAKAGRRKIVLATNIAETSLTIDGVRIVVDAGLERSSLFDPSSGMNRLECSASRAPRRSNAPAARSYGAGVCYRLWGEGAERSLAATRRRKCAYRISRRWRWTWRCGARRRPAALADPPPAPRSRVRAICWRASVLSTRRARSRRMAARCRNFRRIRASRTCC
jgi:hypothetical protein